MTPMRYRVTVLDARGSFAFQYLEALDETGVRQLLAARSLTPVRIEPAKAKRTRTSRFPLLLFSHELLALLDAGMPLLDAVETLAGKTQKPEHRALQNLVVASLREGRTFSAALELQSASFPPLYVATVRAAEKTGDLAPALTRYIHYQEQVDAIKTKLVSASIYPVLLLAVGGMVTLFLMIYVVPRFASIYADGGRELPLLSAIMLKWGTLVGEHGAAILGSLAGLTGVVVLALRQRVIRAKLVARIWRLPVLGEQLKIYQLARFYRTLGMLLASGIPAVSAMEQSAGLLSRNLSLALARTVGEIRQGQAMSVALERNGLTTSVAQRMLKVGEKSGRMGEMMERIAAFHDQEQARFADWFTRLIEPLLMTVIGVIIGGIVVLLYLPIFDLAGSIQ